MNQAKFSAHNNLVCPKCQQRATRRLYDIVACEECHIAWPDGIFDKLDGAYIQRAVEFLAKCEWRQFSTKPVTALELAPSEEGFQDRVIVTLSAVLVDKRSGSTNVFEFPNSASRKSNELDDIWF